MPISIHALREEGDICCQQHSAHRPISIHALREEGDVSAHRWQGIQEHFYPRPPRGGRLNTNIANGFAGVFLSTPSARRATCILSFLMLLYQIFLSTPSARRATPASVGFAVAVFRFLSTPSARRATHNVDGAKRHRNISIHALREEGDSCILFEELLDLISIHALREEGDDLRHKGRARGSNFYPRPPRGGRRRREVALNVCKKISIHALREEGDEVLPGDTARVQLFLSTPSARRATMALAAIGSALLDFYPRPPRGGRQQKQRQNLYFLINYTTFCTNLEEL